MFYLRKPGQTIKLLKIGFQWWHGPNILFRTYTHIYVFGPLSYWRISCVRFTFADYIQTQMQCYKVAEYELPQAVKQGFYV